MSEKAATPHNQAKSQRKPRSTRSTKNVNHHQTKDEKEIIDDKNIDADNKTEPSLDTKYCKKAIDNNWNKYETEMETYEEFEKKENLGADYEELSKMPVSSGSHFQFKHEKIVLDNSPTEYDKHFQYNIDVLTAALLSLPFLERNSLDKSIFRPIEMENMYHRSNKFGVKYKNMVKRNVEVVVSAEGNCKLSGSSESKGDPPKETSLMENMEMLPERTPVIEEVVNSETSNSILVNDNVAATSDLDIYQQTETGKDVVKNILVETISPVEIALIASPNIINENPAPKSTEDLEKWLDDFLDGS